MFESDDFDQVLSQFEFPEVDNASKEIVIPSTESVSQGFIACTNESFKVSTIDKKIRTSSETIQSSENNNNTAVAKTPYDTQNRHEVSSVPEEHSKKHNAQNLCRVNDQNSSPNIDNCKHLKRKIISSHFDQERKRKFPGPAGLLMGVLEEVKDESICQIEFLSQDMDFTESNLRRDLFESPIWKRLLSDTQDWKVHHVDSIKNIKQQALAGNLRRRKAQTVTAFIEAVDRSVIDPLIILRDETGSIKCTLHRDAWSTFSPYIVSEFCALVLQKPTVLTTGGAFKKHYLNITLSNILAIFSCAVLKDNKALPDDYKIVYEEDFTVIKNEMESIEPLLDSSTGAEDVFDGLDNFFSDEIF